MKRRSWSLVFRNAAEGIVYGFRTQRNVRVHSGVAVIMCSAGFIFGISRTDWMFVLTAIFLVLVTELMNTAVEAAVDLAHPHIHPLAKAAKDTAAGAVLLAAVFAVVIGCMVFFKPVLHWLGF
ncbi:MULTISPECIES: diacylglycerol kinase family protein [Paenibacillus]|jgi:undecaprenol kinase|uniref:Diacylglycerol kinase n=1 Tax=Paenibacillus illinoisensis TaxID=59845 RepID=A0A2W0C638_9BACL|nr:MULTISPECIES: diacylglycerol kinase family protein [Paenibacillus]MBY0216451.1 diacylglycerol kinase family protein [Paenibacillus illinoisensis]MCM3206018.1 diacylglycerol kinase family protein [Paenibacillus illinoisensis]PAD30812.1 diacylglycerol kinase [Paenibacillus sp. 7523-1]PAF30593.1 diacylglycerol kinase [Paenibacillus sp. 7516]PYY27477.1 Diacylglycerol kinase [Paenibacillus illinoisensis]